jgi:hypothetical protein
MEERVKQAFASAQSSCGQLITLSTSALTALVIFLEALFLRSNTPAKFCIGGSWVFLLLSSLSGAVALLAITGTLATKEGELQAKTVYDRNIRLPVAAQVSTFMVGMAFLVAFGFFSAMGVQ